jgi:hypothetical protein
MLDPNKEVIKWKPFNKYEVARKGKAIYEKIRDKMEAEHKGEALAIEVESGDYFLGKSAIDSTDKGRQKHPDGLFYVVRIGKRAYISLKNMRG